MGAEEDRKAKETVLAVLEHKSLNMVDFSISKRRISPELYQKVAKAIKDNKITVMVAPSMLPADVGGLYIPALTLPDKQELYDLLVLRSPTLGTSRDQKLKDAQVIVHECTHAGFDLLGTKEMNHLEHEAAAYVAGARYMIEEMLELGGHPEKVTFTGKIESAAWAIALKQSDGEEASTKLFNALDVAIMNHPTYKADAKKEAINDGVGRTWKPAPTAQKPAQTPSPKR